MSQFWDQWLAHQHPQSQTHVVVNKTTRQARKRYYLADDRSLYLTPREYECICLIKQGMTMKQVANDLTLSPRTVEFYLQNIKQRFGVNRMGDMLNRVAATKLELKEIITH